MKKNVTAALLIAGVFFTLSLFVNANVLLDFDVKNNIDVCLESESEVYFEGMGTKESPYVLSTAQNLVDLSNLVNDGVSAYSGAYYILANDIDMTGIELAPIGGKPAVQITSDGTEKNVINTFSGNFNGNGHSVRNVEINAALYKYIGFFGYGKNASVDNLRLENISVSCENTDALYAGSLFGVYDSDERDIDLHIKNCYVNGNLTVKADRMMYVGGLVGYNRIIHNTAIIENCYVDANIDAYSKVGVIAGGFVGEIASGADISKCIVVGNINAESKSSLLYVGGVVGKAKNNDWFSDYDEWLGLSAPKSVVVTAGEEAVLQGDDTYVNIYNVAASVEFAENGEVGNIVADGFSDVPITVKSCYYDLQFGVNGSINSQNGVGKEKSELFSKKFLTEKLGFDFARTWTMISGEPDLVSYRYIDCDLDGDVLNINLVGAGNSTVFAAVYCDNRISNVKVIPYADEAVPVLLSGIDYDYITLIVLDSNLSPLCDSVVVD